MSLRFGRFPGFRAFPGVNAVAGSAIGLAPGSRRSTLGARPKIPMRTRLPILALFVGACSSPPAPPSITPVPEAAASSVASPSVPPPPPGSIASAVPPAPADTDAPPPNADITKTEARLGRVDQPLGKEFLARIEARNEDFRRCYAGLAKQSGDGVYGRVTARVTVDKDGGVVSAVDAGTDVPDAPMRDCVLGVWRRMRFPAGTGLTFSAPLVFARP